jgi:hypothetical protein
MVSTLRQGLGGSVSESASRSGQYAMYFSHSWDHDDLPVNLMLWKHLSKHCQLWIDRPEPTADEDRPYFISRIESLLRRADVFVCCLPTRILLAFGRSD